MPDAPNKPILLCYDGSDDAFRAIEFAGSLFPGRKAVVLSVWEKYGVLSGIQRVDDSLMQEAADQQAADGCERAVAGRTRRHAARGRGRARGRRRHHRGRGRPGRAAHRHGHARQHGHPLAAARIGLPFGGAPRTPPAADRAVEPARRGARRGQARLSRPPVGARAGRTRADTPRCGSVPAPMNRRLVRRHAAWDSNEGDQPCSVSSHPKRSTRCCEARRSDASVATRSAARTWCRSRSPTTASPSTGIRARASSCA